MSISEFTLKSKDEPVRRFEVFTDNGRRRELSDDQKAPILLLLIPRLQALSMSPVGPRYCHGSRLDTHVCKQRIRKTAGQCCK